MDHRKKAPASETCTNDKSSRLNVQHSNVFSAQNSQIKRRALKAPFHDTGGVERELSWRGRFALFEAHGYRLRQRYRPDWVASSVRNDVDASLCEDYCSGAVSGNTFSAASFPEGFHLARRSRPPDVQRVAKVFRHGDVSNEKYYFVDLGIPSRFRDDDDERLAIGRDGFDQDVPELKSKRLYDPFLVDVFIIGNLVKKEFVQVSDFVSIGSYTRETDTLMPLEIR